MKNLLLRVLVQLGIHEDDVLIASNLLHGNRLLQSHKEYRFLADAPKRTREYLVDKMGEQNSTLNDSLAQNSVSGQYADNYQAANSGGCFTKLQYTGHQHTSSCQLRRGEIKIDWGESGSGDGWFRYVWKCSKCGEFMDCWTQSSGSDWTGKWHTCGGYDCGNSPKNINPVYVRTCDRENGELTKVEIIYD